MISITVLYSPNPREVVEKTVRLEEGSTVAQALQASGMAEILQATDLSDAGVGVWGKKTTPTHVLRDLDRLEVYRALTVDPKVARRERFAGQGAKRAAGLFAKRRLGAKAGY